MYTGNLIDELFATVQRVEARAEACTRQVGEPAELERWYTKVHQVQPRMEQNLLGVA